ncbi:MAG TPA: phospho-N-acetylmuramoyl-pentapeptide-transferase [Saprospirales bacterium]|jgi:phospho-N-acetylmuramoyl-pentapeptide-transferase|nr:phospho-N-acetylmuramoyl-pentapeptide-transferase [Saprospiraceae bacterium]HAV29766.1 phospho-N-acetylmuramoyl-pentapeptide-transferase [Saprospirales bacterium]HAW05238.1 phospho-N-acetylmuramoyl-pentapeptide-transferase [Saprospirales bacterium]
MLYHVFEYLEKHYHVGGAGLFQYISFRAGAAIITSLLISLLFGNRIIRSLKRLQVGETVRELGLDGQKEKEGTPTMGGFIILLATWVPCLLFARLDNIYIILMLVTTLWMTAIGFADDYIKVFKKDKNGLAGKFKIFGQVVLGVVVAIVMLYHSDVVIRMPIEDAIAGGYEVMDEFTTEVTTIGQAKEMVNMAYVKSTLTNIPFFKGNNFEYSSLLGFLGDNAKHLIWIVFLPIVIFIITAVSNAANLTDGIDGLATGVSAIIGATLGILAYVSGNTIIADYLNILYIPHSGELVIFAACFVGGCVGFLWFNSYPAKVFMGDTGSLTIGAIIATMAILLRKEFLIPILCGIFVVENISVVLQVGYFKYTRKKYGEGRRIFKMAPLHHHFQKQGMHEARIVTRFWIVGIILAVLTMITLKVR